MNKPRRKAVHCELVEASKTSPGYFKYQVTIREINGHEHIVPAYGKDMQDAISRLIWTEKKENISSKKISVILISTLIISIVGPSVLSIYTNNPLVILSSFVLLLIFGLGTYRIDKYLTVGK